MFLVYCRRKPEVILGADLFGGQVVNALLYCVGLSQTDPLPVSELRQFSDLATKVSRKKHGATGSVSLILQGRSIVAPLQ